MSEEGTPTDVPKSWPFQPAPAAPGGHGYHFREGDPLVTAVNVALVTRRPLLLTGQPGVGKSSLARAVADATDRRYYECVVTSRTTARELVARFDAVRRLADAQAAKRRLLAETARARYVEPGPLWWAFERDSARRRGGGGPWSPPAEPFAARNATRTERGAVVLLDEIDKADPDVPNDLLVPLTGEFVVEDIGYAVDRTKDPWTRWPLIVITSNGERDMPGAFLRRCVTCEIPAHGQTELETIAKVHFGAPDSALVAALIQKLREQQKIASDRHERSPGTAEFLDALRACVELGVGPAGAEEARRVWDDIVRCTVVKGLTAR